MRYLLSLHDRASVREWRDIYGTIRRHVKDLGHPSIALSIRLVYCRFFFRKSQLNHNEIMNNKDNFLEGKCNMCNVKFMYNFLFCVKCWCDIKFTRLAFCCVFDSVGVCLYRVHDSCFTVISVSSARTIAH